MKKDRVTTWKKSDGDEDYHVEGKIEPESLECLHSALPAVTPTAISSEDFLRKQSSDDFCQDLLSRLEKGSVSDAKDFMVNTEGLLVSKARLDGAIQIVVPKSLRDRILHIAHFPASAGDPGGR